MGQIAIIRAVRQLITRIDDDLHDRLKARAAAEGRSMNAFVTDVLARAVVGDADGSVRAHLARAGLLVVPPQPVNPPTLEAVLLSTSGAGRAASEALERDRQRG
jgi:plasmid stability protein